eukprot:scaffold4362_cov106-Isochrysis_galbana.AAC.3
MPGEPGSRRRRYCARPPPRAVWLASRPARRKRPRRASGFRGRGGGGATAPSASLRRDPALAREGGEKHSHPAASAAAQAAGCAAGAWRPGWRGATSLASPTSPTAQAAPKDRTSNAQAGIRTEYVESATMRTVSGGRGAAGCGASTGPGRPAGAGTGDAGGGRRDALAHTGHG